MVDPPLSALLTKVDSRFTLCILVGKRARQLTSGSRQLVDCDSLNTITIAAKEVNENRVTYTKKKSKVRVENTTHNWGYFND